MTSSEDDHTRAVPSAAVIAGRYRLDTLVGRGGTAEVWAATDTSLDRTVALKLVTVAHDESSARAADEARTLAQLSHPNLVQVFDAGTDTGGRPWVVMEFVDGETLGDAMRKGPLPVARVAEVGTAVADALAHVHAAGLVHRDVKPGNVLLGRVPKLTDFGIARLVDAAKVTSTGLMVGTAAYLAPEQVAGEPVGPAVDVYALGLVLLEALTGQREYDGPAVEAAMSRLARPPAIPSNLPAGWDDVLAAMTARQPVHRPTAAQVSTLLQGLQNGTSSATTVLPAPVERTTVLPRTAAVQQPTVTPQPAAAPAARRSSRTALWVTLAVLAVAVLGGLGVALSQRQDATPSQIAPIDTDTPDTVKDPLQNLVTRVEQL